MKKRLLVCVPLAMALLAWLALSVGADPSPAPSLPITPPIPSPQPNLFGRMFPDPPGLTSQSNQELADLAGSMHDPNVTDPNPGSRDNDFVPSGDTYFGQFIDHDLTLDSSPSPTEPENAVGEPDGRTFQFDLDSVYGKGPFGDPELYAADTSTSSFRTRTPTESGTCLGTRTAPPSWWSTGTTRTR